MKKSFLKTLIEFYGPSFPVVLARQFKNSWYEIGEYLAWFWSTNDFKRVKSRTSVIEKCLIVTYTIITALLFLVILLAFKAGRWQLASALIITYPIIGVHLLALPVFVAKIIWFITHPKKLLRNLICKILEHHVKKLRAAHEFTVIAVAGSVGKTSTKSAIAQMLEASGKRVLVQQGNYNDRVTVPLVLFDLKLNNLFSPISWVRIVRSMRRTIHQKQYTYDVVVLELGTDGPGQMRHFAYLRPELAVITSVAPEHMEFFGTLDAVAKEELVLAGQAQQVLINNDDTAEKYLKDVPHIAYGSDKTATMRITNRKSESLYGQTISLQLADEKLTAHTVLLGKQGAIISLAAASVAFLLDITAADIERAISGLKPFAGRMQILPGAKNSTLIDDTYNASPLAVKAALDVVYAAKAPQKIVVLGDMNELGDSSAAAHEDIGAYCDSKKLDYVLTLGPQSAAHLAPVATSKGCDVHSFASPYEVGAFIQSILKKDALVLFKGSQNRVFAEEAIKSVLKDKSDEQKLVRQSKTWLDKKAKQFTI